MTDQASTKSPAEPKPEWTAPELIDLGSADDVAALAGAGPDTSQPGPS